MARSRKFRSTRRIPDSERSLFEQKLGGRYSRTLDRTDLLNLIRGGEDTYIEFKIRLVNLDKITAEIVAMANSGGGAIVFGVTDQRRLEGLDDPEQVEEQLIDICRNQIKPALLPRIDKVSFDNATRIVVLQVDDRRAPHSTPDNRYFIRIGSTKREAEGDEIASLYSRSRTAAFEDLPLVGANAEDVDEALLWSYIRDLEGENFREPAGFPTNEAMRDLYLAVKHGIDSVPTLAGLLLFGHNSAVERMLPQSRVVLTRYSGRSDGSAVVEKAEFTGNLPSLFERSLSFIKRYVDLWDARPPRAAVQGGNGGEAVQPRANYCREATFEALTNLLVHRDYSIIGASARVRIFDDRLEFINPSRTQPATRKSLEYGAMQRRNPRLHRVFSSREYGLEACRRGIPALRRLQYAFARRLPRIAVTDEEFRLEIEGL